MTTTRLPTLFTNEPFTLDDAFRTLPVETGKPTAIIARTVRGKGAAALSPPATTRPGAARRRPLRR